MFGLTAVRLNRGSYAFMVDNQWYGPAAKSVQMEFNSLDARAWSPDIAPLMLFQALNSLKTPVRKNQLKKNKVFYLVNMIYFPQDAS